MNALLRLLGRAHGGLVHGRRVRVLAAELATLLPRCASVLDVGCGDGRLAAALLDLRPDLAIDGVDTRPRAGARVPTRAYDGRTLPFADRTFDAALAVDVLHHADDPPAILAEMARVARKCVVLKDHYRRGFAAAATLRFMDWVGNRAHGVALPHNYFTPEEWRTAYASAGLRVEVERTVQGLYPVPADLLFERGLHFVAYLRRGQPTGPEVPSPWERAYLRFESPAGARRKIAARLARAGANAWPREARMLEICCGSGPGLDALSAAGRRAVVGLDSSAALLARYRGPAARVRADCRRLPFAARSFDVLCVHGGLHHLADDDDLERTLLEARRVLQPSGRLLLVEPWPTVFLRLVRALARRPLVRRVSPRVDAFQTMVEHELETYERWLARPREIEAALARHFRYLRRRTRRGALEVLAVPRPPLDSAADLP